MSVASRPPFPQLIPDSAPFTPGAAHLAQRLLRRPGVARGRRDHAAVAGPVRGADAGAARGKRRRRRRRRRALARPDAAARRAHEARRRPAAAPAHDGGDGPAGLRTMRLQLSGLFQRAFFAKGRAAESLRARRQGNRPHAQDALPGARQFAARRRAKVRQRSRRLPLLRLRRPPRPAARATIPLRRSSSRARASTSRAPARKTWHIEFDLAETGIDYTVGDAFGIFPTNDPALADAVIAALDAPADFPIGGRALRDVLIDGVSLGPAPDMLFQLFSYITGGERRQKAKALAAGEDPDGDAATLDVLAAIEKFPACAPIPKPSSRRSIRCSRGSTRSRPRPRSIPAASRSPSTPCAIRSTAARGSASPRPSSPSASRPATRSRSTCRRRTHFGLPADPSVPIIMIGPGTGIAPFRAFLHERMATKAPGRNWLFFGHQHSNYDFFYEDELAGMKAGARAHAPHARLVARRRPEDLRAGPHARGRPRSLGLARRGRARLCLRRRQAHGQGRGARAHRRGRAASACARPNEAVAFVADLKKSGRYQQDVY